MKFLELGTDKLLEGYSFGGTVVGTEGKRDHDEPGVPGTSVPNLKWARVHEDEEKAPVTVVHEDVEKVPATASKVE